MILKTCLIMAQPHAASAEGRLGQQPSFTGMEDGVFFTHKSCTHAHRTCKSGEGMLELNISRIS